MAVGIKNNCFVTLYFMALPVLANLVMNGNMTPFVRYFGGLAKIWRFRLNLNLVRHEVHGYSELMSH
ncbi:MAG: hypothetical protein OEQ39_03930 [Gammaproteobacteria bacterium]|nr:hypothetical protein [Gammaproteobacteria bacterium]MDH3468794.1 hypothetical protein [Gammaproteobacteria bacterium]